MPPHLPLYWIPRVRVGPFAFGAPIAPLVARRAVVLFAEQREDVEDDCYRVVTRPGVVVYARNGLIVAVLCDVVLTFRGLNLLGLHHVELARLLGPPESIDDLVVAADRDGDGLNQWEWRYNRLSLTIFGSLRTGFAETAIVYGPLEEELT